VNIHKIIENDMANGPGLRTTVFCTGCEHRCEGCHAQHLWEFAQGEPLSKEHISTIIQSLAKNGIHRDLSILGGEPFHPNNINGTIEIAKRAKQYFPDIKIWVWTGYQLEDKLNELKKKRAINYIDVIIDGPFRNDLPADSKSWKGSLNQQMWIRQKTELGSQYVLAS